MKALYYNHYGPTPDVFDLRDVPRPTPKNDELLIAVKASSINSWDWDRMTGRPRLYQLLHGIGSPRLNILGADVAGVVEAVGKSVTRFQPGDAVFGDLCAGGWGGFAAFVCAKEGQLVKKPSGLTFEQAAAIPQGGVMAMQCVKDGPALQPGHDLLINGAGGSVGTFLIQMAKNAGAHVTAVDHGDKLKALHTLGADHIIDYTQEDFTQNGKQYDMIVDVVAQRPLSSYVASLKPNGIFKMVGGTIGTILNVMLLKRWVSTPENRKLTILAHAPNKYLEEIAASVVAGTIRPVIDRTFALEASSDAMRHYGTAKAVGKVVITV